MSNSNPYRETCVNCTALETKLTRLCGQRDRLYPNQGVDLLTHRCVHCGAQQFKHDYGIRPEGNFSTGEILWSCTGKVVGEVTVRKRIGGFLGMGGQVTTKVESRVLANPNCPPGPHLHRKCQIACGAVWLERIVSDKE